MPDYRLAAKRAALKYGIDPAIFLRQINAESGFNPNSSSPAGARGIAQFIPSTARAYGVNLNDGKVTDDLDGAAKYMAANLKRAGGSYARALSIYNSGRPDGYKSIPETKAYVAKILNGRDPKVSVSSSSSRSRTTTTPAVAGVDTSAQRGALIAQFVESKHPDMLTFATGIAALKAQDTPGTPAKTTTVKAAGSSVSTPTPSGVGSFEGKKVAAWIVPALKYARAHGWKGTVTSGYRSYADQQRIYNSGVRPAAKPGTSNHEGTDFPRGAVDTTDAAQLSAILKRSPYASKLIWAGTKDPVHLSHPHGGSYLWLSKWLVSERGAERGNPRADVDRPVGSVVLPSGAANGMGGTHLRRLQATQGRVGSDRLDFRWDDLGRQKPRSHHRRARPESGMTDVAGGLVLYGVYGLLALVDLSLARDLTPLFVGCLAGVMIAGWLQRRHRR